jgi:long-chain acyl-CoA synthetase
MTINSIDFLRKRFLENKNLVAIVSNNVSYSYSWLDNRISYYIKFLSTNAIQKGSVISIKGDFTPNCIALFLALVEYKCIVVPVTLSVKNEEKLLNISGVDYQFTLNDQDDFLLDHINSRADNHLYKIIRENGNPGLVLFSSGTSGEPKCAVHDFSKLLKKFEEKKKALRTLNFLLFDHWGGLNTMLHILSNNGVVIPSRERSPIHICELIEKYEIELLPASPTFLNLLILSESYRNFNMSSLRIISYGTEPMLPSTLLKLKSIFPNVKLLQTYGLIELGVLNSKSENDESLWVKLGGTGYQLRVVDGLLEIKAESAMLGYLNAPSPFTEDGWFKTGDAVEVNGDYFRILGRKSELINVGGEKVYPTEIENVIQEIENVAEVTVFGEKSPIMGMIVVAKVRLKLDEDKKVFSSKLRAHCKAHLESFKIPVKVIIDNELQHGERLKKKRV